MAQEIKTQPSPSPVTPTSVPRMTYEEFLEWGDGINAEWVDGEVILMSPPSLTHQQVLSFLAALLQFFVEANDSGEVLFAPFQMRLRTRPSGREPDLLFVTRDRLDKLHDAYLDGPADLAVEIISPDSRARDRVDKYHEYEQAGVMEYWLIDPVRELADFYQPNADGVYSQVTIPEDGIYRSKVMEGLWLRVDWLWQDPLPTLMSVLKEWGLIS